MSASKEFPKDSTEVSEPLAYQKPCLYLKKKADDSQNIWKQ